MEASDIHNRFVYHPPESDAVKEAHENIRTQCRHLAYQINDLIPESREKSLAITHLEEVMMWANAALARN